MKISITTSRHHVLGHCRHITGRLRPSIRTSRDTRCRSFIGRILTGLIGPTCRQLGRSGGHDRALTALQFGIHHLIHRSHFGPRKRRDHQLVAAPRTRISLICRRTLSRLDRHRCRSITTFARYARRVGRLGLACFQHGVNRTIVHRGHAKLIDTTTAITATTTPTRIGPTACTSHRFQHTRSCLGTGGTTTTVRRLGSTLGLSPGGDGCRYLVKRTCLVRGLPNVTGIRFGRSLQLGPDGDITLGCTHRLGISLAPGTPRPPPPTPHPTTPPGPPKQLFDHLFTKH